MAERTRTRRWRRSRIARGCGSCFRVLREEHRKSFGSDDDLLVGLQLTHSGRFCRPNGGDKPRIAYHHPLLDEKFDIRADDDSVVCSDDELERLIDSFVAAARLA